MTHRKATLSLLVLACGPVACAQTALAPPTPAVAQPATNPSAPAAPTTAAPAVIEAMMPRSSFVSSGDATFDAWRESFATRAIARGYAPALVTSLLTGLRPNPRIIAANDRQPEFVRPVWEYIGSAVSDQRVSTGRARLAAEKDMLERASARSGVPGPVMVAIWGVETSYGAIRGDTDVAEALATLAYQGRRTTFGETELLAVLEILTRGEARREQLVGSWAGAMGHTQFIPSTFLSSAVDGNGDGRRNIWGDPEDALASTGNYLAKSGWRAGEPWGAMVSVPPGFDWSQMTDAMRPGSDWARSGITLSNGLPLPADLQGWNARLLAPAGARGTIFLVGRNFQAIKAYNNSDAYAVAVGLLSDRIAGSDAMPTRWPFSDPPIPRSQVTVMQEGLNALGFDAGTPDGQAGPRTRRALQAFQASRGLIADGYPSASALAAIEQARTGGASR